jgi:hypothetical protein
MIATILSIVPFGGGFNFIHFVVGFLLMVCALAIVIILCKWLLGLMGVPIPQPLLVVLGIIIFVILLLMLLSWSGAYSW